MKTNLLRVSLLVCTFALGAVARAESDPVPALAKADEVDHMVYLSFLPEPDDLMKDAAANGLTVMRLDHTASKVVVTYKYPDGHTATLGYALLSATAKADRLAERQEIAEERRTERASTTVIERDPEIVYVERPYSRTRVVYRDRYDDFWLPLTVGLGIGYISGHNSHHYYPRYSHYYPRYSRGYGHGGRH